MSVEIDKGNSLNLKILHRKSLSPGIQFYALGKCQDQNLKAYLKIKRSCAKPADAIKLAETPRISQKGEDVKPET